MVKQTASIVLFGKKITTVSGEVITDKKSIEINKNCLKHRGESSTKKKPRNAITKYYWINPLLELPSELKNYINSTGGRNLVFMMGMTSERSELPSYQIYMPKTEWFMNYLTEEEKRKIEEQGSDGGLYVQWMNARTLKTLNLTLKLWPSDGDSEFVLEKKWAKLVCDNGPVKKKIIEVWCFRVGPELRVAVNAGTRAVFVPQGDGGGVRIGGGNVN